MRVFIVIIILTILAWQFGPAVLEKTQNKILAHNSYTVSTEAEKLHQTLVIGDLHADSALWRRSLLDRSDRGHVDIPRMREGNVALQMFTTVTKSPLGLNYDENSADALDSITLLALVQTWPPDTWTSLKARALYQAARLRGFAAQAPDEFMLVYNKADLAKLLELRLKGSAIVGGLIGTEGSHALDGQLNSVEELYQAGFRMMSLQHFFDNKLGGSLHGSERLGLSDFGRQAVQKMIARGIMIDVSHSSEQVVRDVLGMSDVPLIVSHTGLQGHCDSARNISDELMVDIAAGGGLIGIGFWDGAVCEPSPDAIVRAIRYGIDLLGEDHIALGSDFDGTVETPFDSSELVVLTDRMLAADFTEVEIRKVMGGNMVRYLATNLP